MESEGPRVMGCQGPNRSGRPDGTEGAEQTKERRDRGGEKGKGRGRARGGGGACDPGVEGLHVGLGGVASLNVGAVAATHQVRGHCILQSKYFG